MNAPFTQSNNTIDKVLQQARSVTPFFLLFVCCLPSVINDLFHKKYQRNDEIEILLACCILCQKIESLTYVLQACFKGGCRGGGVRLPSFRQISYSFSSRGGGAHYPHQVLLAPPDFQTLRHACIRVCKVVVDHNGLLTQGRYIYLFDMNYFKLLLT